MWGLRSRLETRLGWLKSDWGEEAEIEFGLCVNGKGKNDLFGKEHDWALESACTPSLLHMVVSHFIGLEVWLPKKKKPL